MSLRLAVVVATHPEDHSVDLVMADDGSRLVGVQVMTMNGSSRSGSVDMPSVPEKANKWDISQRTGQDQIAVVGYINRQPVVTGFLYPQINQMLFKDPLMRFDRHQSDVMSSIDGNGNVQISHPSGAYIRIGESPDMADYAGQNADESLKADRNTGRKVDVRIALADTMVQLTMSKTGTVELKAEGEVTVIAPTVTIDAGQTTCTGALTVQGLLSFESGCEGVGGMNLVGDLLVTGNGTFGGVVTDSDGDGGA